MDEKSESKIQREASAWYSRLREDNPSQENRAEFAAWLEADARHAAAFDDASAVVELVRNSKDLHHLATSIRKKYENSNSQTQRRHNQWRRILLSPRGFTIAGAALSSFLLLTIGFVSTTGTITYDTETAEIDRISLADGSFIDLGPESRVKTTFTTDERRVELLAGEAFFEVARDTDRVFIVESANAEIRVLGTKFNVHRGPEGVRVAVAEGEVKVMHDASIWRRIAQPLPKQSGALERTLEAGEQVKATSNLGIDETTEVTVDDPGAWRSGLLIYPDNSLREIIADLNRYSETPITLASDELSELRLFAAISADHIDQMLSDIEELYPVEIDRSQPKRIIIRPLDPA